MTVCVLESRIELGAPSPSAPMTVNGCPVRAPLAGSARFLAHGFALVETCSAAGGTLTVPSVPPARISVHVMHGEAFSDYWESGEWDTDL